MHWHHSDSSLFLIASALRQLQLSDYSTPDGEAAINEEIERYEFHC
jgi:hypothetical protein